MHLKGGEKARVL